MKTLKSSALLIELLQELCQKRINYVYDLKTNSYDFFVVREWDENNIKYTK